MLSGADAASISFIASIVSLGTAILACLFSRLRHGQTTSMCETLTTTRRGKDRVFCEGSSITRLKRGGTVIANRLPAFRIIEPDVSQQTQSVFSESRREVPQVGSRVCPQRSDQFPCHCRHHPIISSCRRRDLSIDCRAYLNYTFLSMGTPSPSLDAHPIQLSS